VLIVVQFLEPEVVGFVSTVDQMGTESVLWEHCLGSYWRAPLCLSDEVSSGSAGGKRDWKSNVDALLHDIPVLHARYPPGQRYRAEISFASGLTC
jgi:hypothetical protein